MAKLYEGFGFVPDESGHHFRVLIPAGSLQDVLVTEHFTFRPDAPAEAPSFAQKIDGQVKVVLPRQKWNAIADEVRAEFNKRLKAGGVKSGRWKTGDNYLPRLLGKELVLLAWAIEDADPGTIHTAILNWLGLAQEERWWLYTMTNAATGHAASGRGRGWRKAIRFALTENPVTENNRREEPLILSMSDPEDHVERKPAPSEQIETPDSSAKSGHKPSAKTITRH